MTIKLKLALGAGHGLNTPGKRIPKALDPKETREWTLNNRVCNYIEEFLKDYIGVSIIRLDDRTGRRDVPLKERTDKANAWGADILLSQHHNAGARLTNAGGVTVYVFNGSLLPKTLEYQKKLYDQLIKHTGLKGNRASPLMRANFHMLRESRCSAILPENGFMDSRVDAPIILTDKFARQVAQANVEFLVTEFKLERREPKFNTDKVEFVGTIKVPSLNVRDAGTVTGTKVLRTLSKGDPVIVYAVHKNWYMIGQDEWISNVDNKYVAKGITTTEFIGEVHGVRQFLNIRTGPNVEYDKITVAKNGDKFRVRADFDGWYYLGDGRFASGRFIRPWVATPKPEPKPEPKALKVAILMRSGVDYYTAEALARHLKCPIFVRGTEKEISVERLYVVGGPRPTVDADEIIMLSGADRFETSAQVAEYIKD